MVRSSMRGLRCVGLVLSCLALSSSAVRMSGENEDHVSDIAVSHNSSDGNYLERLLTRMQADPINVFLTLKAAVDGVNASVVAFTAQPPQYAEGFAQIRLQMWGVIDLLAEPDFKETQQWTDMQQAWNDGFQNLPDLAQAAVDRFQQDGDLVAFKEIVDLAINTSQTVAISAFPILNTTFEAYGSLMRGVSDAWVDYTNGDTEVALDKVWVAFSSSISVMVGPDRAASPEFQQTMTDLDTVVTNLLRNIVEFKKAKIESTICYRQQQVRSSRNPSLCENNQDWDYDGKEHCFPRPHNGQDCESTCQGNLTARCPLFCPSSKPFCCKKDDAAGPQHCSSAVYVDHDFANGTASDYYQCVSEVIETLAEIKADIRPQVHHEKPLLAKSADMKGSLVARRSAVSLHRSTKLDKSVRFKSFCWLLFWKRSCQSGNEGPGDGRSMWGTHPARCDASSTHPSRIGGLCYGSCSQFGRWIPVIDEDLDPPTETAECQQDCLSPFGKDGVFGQDPLTWNVCSNTTAAITDANNKIMDLAKNTIGAVNEAVQAINAQRGIDVNLINKIVNAFSDLASHFNRPQCDFTGATALVQKRRLA